MLLNCKSKFVGPHLKVIGSPAFWFWKKYNFHICTWIIIGNV